MTSATAGTVGSTGGRHADGRGEKYRQDWTAVLQRRPASIVNGQPVEYTDVFEIICCDCGDDPGLDYLEVSPELQRVRGPYTLAVGAAAYLEHVDQHRES